MQPVSQHFGSTLGVHVVFQTQALYLLITELVGQECQDARRSLLAFLITVTLRLLDGIAEETHLAVEVVTLAPADEILNLKEICATLKEVNNAW